MDFHCSLEIVGSEHCDAAVQARPSNLHGIETTSLPFRIPAAILLDVGVPQSSNFTDSAGIIVWLDVSSHNVPLIQLNYRHEIYV